MRSKHSALHVCPLHNALDNRNCLQKPAVRLHIKREHESRTATIAPNTCMMPQETVSFGTGMDQDHARFLHSLAPFAITQQDPKILRVNLALFGEHMGKPVGEFITLLHDLLKAQVTVRTSHGKEFYCLLNGARPVSHEDTWDIHLAGAGM